MLKKLIKRVLASLGYTILRKSESDALKQKVQDLRRPSRILEDPDRTPKYVNDFVAEVLGKVHRKVFWGDRLISLDKASGFYDDPEFRAACEEIRGSHEYDQYSGPDGIAWRLHTLVWAAKCALRVTGDFVECGVFKGDMSWVVARCVGFGELDRTFYLYDTFEGFSPKYSSPDDFPLNPGFFEFAQKVYQSGDHFEYVSKRFSGFPNVRVIKGTLPDTLDESSPGQIAYLHIDTNSPVVEVEILNRLFDRVAPGGVVVFDDYGWFEFFKQRHAEDEFMSQRGYSILELPTGQGLVVKR